MPFTNIHCRVPCLPMLAVILPLSACGNETVNLGGGRIAQSLQRGARCIESPIVSESVRVTSQAQLAELEGCEEIDGDLRVDVFPGADLSPLASLRVIDGMLELGSYPDFPAEGVDDEFLDALRAEVDAIVADGYLPSLQGLESLERAAALNLYYLAAEDLSSLSALRDLSGHTGSLPVGFVGVQSSQLQSLHGLQNLENIQDLVLAYNPELESLGSIVLGQRLNNINLIDSPELTSIAELTPVEIATTLYLSNLGISDLESLSNLFTITYGLELSGNRNLQNVDRLANVSAANLFVHSNPVLASIPPLSYMLFLETFSAVDNPQLQSIELALPEHGSGPDSVAGRLLTDPIKVIDIARNAQLTHVSLSAGLQQGRFVAIQENPSLQSLSLGTLSSLESLELTDNAQLSQVDLGALATVGSLSVVDNPSLDTTALAAVRTFETTLTGNAAPANP